MHNGVIATDRPLLAKFVTLLMNNRQIQFNS